MRNRTSSRAPVNPPNDNGHPQGDTHEPDAPVYTPNTTSATEPAPCTNPVGPPTADPPPRPRHVISGIDLDALAIEEDYEQSLADGGGLVIVVRKASGQGYFRANPTLHKAIWMLEVKEGADRGFYLASGDAQRLLRRDENDDIKMFRARLTLCYARDGNTLFLWPLRLPEENKRNQLDEWGQTALRVCQMAETKWMKLYAKRGASCYSWKEAEGIVGEVPWPDVTLDEAATLAFEGKIISDANDPLVRRLLGKE
jgi:hypothetical protein